MRALFGLVGLVVVLAIVGLLAKKQLAATRAPVPALQTATGAAAPASAPTGTVREQSQGRSAAVVHRRLNGHQP